MCVATGDARLPPRTHYVFGKTKIYFLCIHRHLIARNLNVRMQQFLQYLISAENRSSDHKDNLDTFAWNALSTKIVYDFTRKYVGCQKMFL
ncbi:unnamed protein product [Dracunculus medinensis]|uniref:Uncharacterized protein n=1 Tax=Dracunculus medinensis TaxID=318479 RepID=A0A0N4UFP7_DRAME|nr:unnamed protein product [Dracunculus medinensis]